MRTLSIFGDSAASRRLVRSALDDLYDTDPFTITMHYRHKMGEGASHVLEWASERDVHVDHVATPEAAVEYGGDVYAFIGNEDPQPDVVRAIANALADGRDVRDLAEGGVTIVSVEGTVRSTEGEAEVAEEAVELTWDEVAAILDAGDQDHEQWDAAAELMSATAASYNIDTDAYPTWAEVAALIEAEEGGSEAPVEEVEEVEEEPEAESGPLTREELAGKGIAELKSLAKNLGIEGATTMRKEAVIDALLGIEETDKVEETEPEPTGPGYDPEEPVSSSTIDIDIDAIVDAVIARLAERLTS